MADPIAREAYRAVLRRFLASFFSARNAPILATAVAANIVVHNFAFSWISEQLELYSDMRLVILGLSVDFFLIALIGVGESVFRKHRDSGMFEDLHLTGIQPEKVLTAFRFVVWLLLVADTFFEGAIGAIVSYDPNELIAIGAAVGCLFGLAAGWMYANIALVLNLFRRSVWTQLILFCMLNFLLLLTFGSAADRIELQLRRWDQPGSPRLSLVNLITRNQPELWLTYSANLGYWTMMLALSAVCAVIGTAVGVGSRKLRGRFVYWRKQ